MFIPPRVAMDSSTEPHPWLARSALDFPNPFRMSRSGLGLEGRVDDGPVTRQAGRLDEFVVPLHGELLGRLVDERLHEGVEVARIEARRAGGQAARHVEVADDLHAAVVRDLA